MAVAAMQGADQHISGSTGPQYLAQGCFDIQTRGNKTGKTLALPLYKSPQIFKAKRNSEDRQVYDTVWHDAWLHSDRKWILFVYSMNDQTFGRAPQSFIQTSGLCHFLISMVLQAQNK